jgi:hypothetical protein
VSLSEETLKNLLDVLQKLTLAITVVSVALFSNLILSQENIFVKAEGDLKRLEAILPRLVNETPETILARTSSQDFGLPPDTFSLQIYEGDALTTATLAFDADVSQTSESAWSKETFGQVKNLEELRNVWDTVVRNPRHTIRGFSRASLTVGGVAKQVDFRHLPIPYRTTGKPIDFLSPTQNG